MAPPTWLPPLNSHEKFNLSVVASQLEINSWNEPSILVPEFAISIIVEATFYSEKGSNQRTFKGLSTNQVFTFPCSSITTPESGGEIIGDMLSSVSIPFHFDKYIWMSRHLGAKRVDRKDVEGTNSESLIESLIENVRAFLYDLIGQTHNKGRHILPVNLTFSKMIWIPDFELKAWCSWYNEKADANSDFKDDYNETISRPRTEEELYYEASLKFNAAAESSIMELEEAKIDSSRQTCSICFEELEIGSKAKIMPCSHIFHGECLVKWLKESNKCPLCRYKLSTA